jgi:hypothetical protein
MPFSGNLYQRKPIEFLEDPAVPMPTQTSLIVENHLNLAEDEGRQIGNSRIRKRVAIRTHATKMITVSGVYAAGDITREPPQVCRRAVGVS